MPSISKKQEMLMSAVAHGWKPKGSKKPPVPVKVAREFHAADKRKSMTRKSGRGR